MEAITPLDLEGIKVRLQQHLQQEMGKNVTCDVNCWVEDQTVLVFIHWSNSILPNSKTFLEALEQKLSKSSLMDAYHLKVYWILEGGVYPLNTTHLLPSTLTSPSGGNTLTLYQGLKLQQIANKLKKRQYRRLSFRLFALGFGIMTGLALIYLITRPCVVGSCPQLTQAQQAADSALNKVTEFPSEFGLNQVKKQLSTVINQLKAIPPWSAYYPQANEMRLNYEDRMLQLESLMAAIAKASPNQPNEPNRPQSLEQLERIKQNLEKAILMLPELTASDPLKTSIETQKQQYQHYLVKIEQRLQLEKEARQRFQQGIDAGNIAFARQNVAQSVEDWQLVEATWKTAIQRFQAVASDTNLYSQARQYLQKYRYELIKAQSQKQKEEQAYQLYQQGVEQAKKAEDWQKQQQWSQAVKQWHNALISLEQIPQDSFSYQQAQPLITKYQVSLNMAKSQLKKALHRQEIAQYLQKLCYRPETICSYTLQDNLIKVTLTKEYNQKILDTAIEAQKKGNQQIQLNLLNHLSRIEKSLQSISLHTQKTVELYHSDGRLMMTFEPK